MFFLYAVGSMLVKGFSGYTFEDNCVFTAPRNYPLTPLDGKILRFFMVDDNGTTHIMNIKNIRRLVKEDPNTPSPTPDASPVDGGAVKRSRSKRVLHKSTGAVYGSMKAASEALSIAVSKIKTSDEFIIS